MNIERETSFRRVNAVLRAPSVAGRLGLTGAPLVPVDQDTHYLPCGRGFFIYAVRGEVAHVHLALLPGDSAQAPEMFEQHLHYLWARGVRKVRGRYRSSYWRVDRIAEQLGFKQVAEGDGFKVCERAI